MQGDSQLGIPVSSGDTIAAQQKAGERWHDELFRSLNQKHSTAPRTERSNPNLPFGELEMLDLYPSPYDVWAKKIEGLGSKKPSLTQEGGNKIQDHGKKEADLTPIGDGSNEPEQATPLQRLTKTVTDYEAGGHKLTQELRGQFESVIIASDTPSPLVPQMMARLGELRRDGVALLTPEKKQEIDETKAELQSAMRSLPQENAKKFSDLAYVRSLAMGDPELTAGFETQMDTVAPGVLPKLKAYEKAVEPLTKIENEFSEVSSKLASELGQNLITRSTYVDILLKDGDKDAAERYLREAVEKAPSIVENEEFLELMNRAGLTADDLQKPKIRT